MAVLRRYYHMDRAEVASCTIPETRALLKRLPDLLKNEAALMAASLMGGKR